jgi:hypothetical protein
MIVALINLIIWLLVLGIVYWLVVWLIDSVPIPDPPARLIKIGLVVIMTLLVILMLLNFIGIDIGGDLRVPRVVQ